MKIKRIKIRNQVSAGAGSLLPTNMGRPDVELGWAQGGYGVQVYNLMTEETLIIPFSNIIEIMLDKEELPKRRGRPKKGADKVRTKESE